MRPVEMIISEIYMNNCKRKFLRGYIPQNRFAWKSYRYAEWIWWIYGLCK